MLSKLLQAYTTRENDYNYLQIFIAKSMALQSLWQSSHLVGYEMIICSNGIVLNRVHKRLITAGTK